MESNCESLGSPFLIDMNWLDVDIITIFVLVLLVEAKRGFGRALFDLAALLVAVVVIARFEFLWRNLAPHERAALYAMSFVVVGGLLIAIGRLGHQATLISAYPFDMIIGGILGIGAATVLCYGIVHTMALTGGTQGLPATLNCSLLGKEFVTFDMYHKVLYVLQHFDNTRSTVPS